jgi:hypothetical protein
MDGKPDQKVRYYPCWMKLEREDEWQLVVLAFIVWVLVKTPPMWAYILASVLVMVIWLRARD